MGTIRKIKKTTKADNYFGAATLTEWAQAIKTPDHYRFVIAKTDASEEEFSFVELTPAEMMEYSTIPPFKVYFNIAVFCDQDFFCCSHWDTLSVFVRVCYVET